jgi:hypothetical protein
LQEEPARRPPDETNPTTGPIAPARRADETNPTGGSVPTAGPPDETKPTLPMTVTPARSDDAAPAPDSPPGRPMRTPDNAIDVELDRLAAGVEAIEWMDPGELLRLLGLALPR